MIVSKIILFLNKRGQENKRTREQEDKETRNIHDYLLSYWRSRLYRLQLLNQRYSIELLQNDVSHYGKQAAPLPLDENREYNNPIVDTAAKHHRCNGRGDVPYRTRIWLRQKSPSALAKINIHDNTKNRLFFMLFSLISSNPLARTCACTLLII